MKIKFRNSAYNSNYITFLISDGVVQYTDETRAGWETIPTNAAIEKINFYLHSPVWFLEEILDEA